MFRTKFLTDKKQQKGKIMIKFTVKEDSFVSKMKGKFLGTIDGELSFEIVEETKDITVMLMPLHRISVVKGDKGIRCFSDSRQSKGFDDNWVKEYSFYDFGALNGKIWNIISNTVAKYIQDKQIQIS